MERVNLSDTVSISRLVYGMWRVGDDNDTSASYIHSKIEACLSQGITTIDQADIYGDYGAEEILGNCLKQTPGLRDRIEIITKCDIIAPIGPYSDRRVKYYDTSPKHITESVERSLRLLNCETIDLLLIHRPDPFMDHNLTGKALDKLVSSGKVKSVGVSNFALHDWTLLSSAMQTPLVTNQIEMSVVANHAFTNGQLAFLQERGVSPMAWSPLGGGSLFSKEHSKLHARLEQIAEESNTDAAAVAVAWLLAHPAKIIPVMGTNNLSRISNLGDATKVQLDRETWFELYTLANGHEVP